MDYSTLLIFSLASVAVAATPGPDMLLLTSRSVAQGRIAGFATLAGIIVGNYCHALAAALGLSQLFLAMPVAYDVVRYAGAAYLLYLAWQSVTSKAKTEYQIDVNRKDRFAVTMFKQGLLTNLLNPKIVIFVLAFFPQFVNPEASSVVVQMMVLATVFNLIDIIINGAVILAANRASRIFSGNNRIKNLSQYILGTVFAGLAAKLAFGI